MERSYSLSESEGLRARQFEMANQQCLARIGAATLELDACKQQLPQIREQQRQLVQEAVTRVQARDYLQARIEGTNLLVTLPDEAMASVERVQQVRSEPAAAGFNPNATEYPKSNGISQ